MSRIDKALQEMPPTEMQKICPVCQAKLSIFDKFCDICGTRVDATVDSPEQSKSLSGALASEYPSVSRSSKPAPFELQGSPVLELLSHYRNPSRTVRELYFDLGNKLFHLHEFAKAAEAFQQASLTSADQPPMVDILFYLALAYEKDQKNDRAFRVYLEAVLQAPQYLDHVLLHLHAFLTPDIVLTHSTWVTSEWQKRGESIAANSLDRAHIKLLVGHMQLFLADYSGAQEQFGKAVQLAPDVVPGLVGEVLATDRLPLGLTQSSAESGTHLILARLFNALHSYDHALEEANLAAQLARADSDPWVQAQQVRARVLQATGASAEAAAVYYKLGVSLYSRDKLTDALEMLSQSIELRKDNALAYWYQADVYQMLADRTQNLEEQKKYTLKGLEQWEAGFNQRPPGTEDAWVYLTKAFLCEKRAFFPNTIASGYWWEAAACLERAMLLGRQDSYVWTYLGRYHRSLNIETNALEETQRAMDAGDDSNARTYAIYERAAILTNVGRHREAKPLIDELLKGKDESSWTKIVYAIIVFYLHNIDEALKTLGEVLKADAKNLWAYNFRAFCYRVSGKTELANADYDTILQMYNGENPGDREYYAWAQYMRGDPKEAVAIYEDLLKDPAQSVHFSLGLCYLKLGNRELGKPLLIEGIRRTVNTRQLDDLLPDLDDITQFARTLPPDAREQMESIIEQARKTLKQQRKKLQQPLSAEDELRQTFKRFPYKSAAGSWAWIAVRASLARLYREQQRWLEAVEMYRLLLKEGDRFYEASIGLQKTADELFAAGDQAQLKGDFALALKLYREAQSFIPELLAHDAPRLGDLYTRLAFAQFTLADHDNARSSFLEALTSYPSGEVTAPGKAMSDLCKTLLRDPGQYWELRDRWHEWQGDPSLAEVVRNDLSSALTFLDTYLDESLQCKAQNEQSFKPVLPIVLELGTALVPPGDSSIWPLFKTYLPEMRQRIKQDTGIGALFVQIRDNQQLRENEYCILLDEIPVARFQVAIGGRFSAAPRETLEAMGVPHDDLIDAVNPQTGKIGCWVAPLFHQLVLDRGGELWEEPLVYVVHHLEYVLRGNLAWFLGTQEAENLLQQWIAAKHAAWADTALDSADTRLYFVRVLRALAREQVPLHRWEDMLQTLLEPDLASADGSAVLGAVRLRLKPWLPGNPLSSRSVQRAELPAELDRAVVEGLQILQERNDLSSYTTALQTMITFIQESFATKGWNLVLIIHTAELRFLLETLAPSLMILTREEYMTDMEGAENE